MNFEKEYSKCSSKKFYFCRTMPNNELLSAFTPVTKAEWLRQIAKDVKGAPLDTFDWNIDEELSLSPFVHAEDFSVPPQPLWDTQKGWEIDEVIEVTDGVSAQAQALEALQGGAEGLQWVYETPPQASVMEQSLEGIHLDYIGVHFDGPGVRQNPAAIFGLLSRLAKKQNISTKMLHGSVAFNPVRTGAPIIDWRYLIDLLEFTQDNFGSFHIITVDFSRHENTAKALADTLRTANTYLTQMAARGISPEKAAGALQFVVPIGKRYFLEISKIRALKLLWLQVLHAWKAPLTYPTVGTYFEAEAYTDDLYTNMIRSTTMAMSAVMGGADRLSVLPYDSGRSALASYPASFGRRIARNVQHLLKMESGLLEVCDPAAGSYYLEKLTTALAEKAWADFTRTEQ
jgi:methylmalonyl-CoA mutase